MGCGCSLCPGRTGPGGGKTGCYRCSKPEKKNWEKSNLFLKNNFILMWFNAENLPGFPSLVVNFFSGLAVVVLGVAILYCFCRSAKYLSSHHFYFKQTLILLPSAPFNSEEFQIKSQSFSLVATGIHFLGLRLFFNVLVKLTRTFVIREIDFKTNNWLCGMSRSGSKMCLTDCVV